MASKHSVGVDIGSRALHIAHIQHGRSGPSLVNFAGARLPEGSVRDGEVLDTAAVGATLKAILKTAKIAPKEVRLGVANQRVVVRQVDLPWMDTAELKESLRFQVQEHIPIPVEEAELDFHVLDDFTADNDERMLRLLLVAAHRDMVNTHVAAATAAGLRPIGVDLNPFAVMRALTRDRAVGGEGEVLVDIGSGVTNIIVHDNGIPRFVRILVLGGSDITEGITVALNLPEDEAEARKREVGVVADSDDEVARIISDRARRFVDEVRSSLDYYRAQTGGTGISRVILSGGGSLLTGLPEALEAALRLPVERGRPLAHLPVKASQLSPAELALVEPTLATAIGLALGGEA